MFCCCALCWFMGKILSSFSQFDVSGVEDDDGEFDVVGGKVTGTMSREHGRLESNQIFTSHHQVALLLSSRLLTEVSLSSTFRIIIEWRSKTK